MSARNIAIRSDLDIEQLNEVLKIRSLSNSYRVRIQTVIYYLMKIDMNSISKMVNYSKVNVHKTISQFQNKGLEWFLKPAGIESHDLVLKGENKLDANTDAKRKLLRLRMEGEDYDCLRKELASGISSLLIRKQVQILMLLFERKDIHDVAKIVGCQSTTVIEILDDYIKDGLGRVKKVRNPKSNDINSGQGSSALLSEDEEILLLNIIKELPPEGQIKWTLQLIVERFIESVGKTDVCEKSIAKVFRKRGVTWKDKKFDENINANRKSKRKMLSLSTEEHKLLFNFVKYNSIDEQVLLKSKILLMSNDQMHPQAIAETCNCSIDQVYFTIKKYKLHGFDYIKQYISNAEKVIFMKKNVEEIQNLNLGI